MLKLTSFPFFAVFIDYIFIASKDHQMYISRERISLRRVSKVRKRHIEPFLIQLLSVMWSNIKKGAQIHGWKWS